jgi:hypothetical protein
MLQGQVISSDWKYIGTLKEGDIYLEANGVKRSGTFRTFRYMSVDKSGEVSEVKCSMDCKNKAVAFIEHWSPGQPLPLVKLNHKPDWIKFPPNSIWDKFYKSLCTESVPTGRIETIQRREDNPYGNIISKVLPVKTEKFKIIQEPDDKIQNNLILQKVSLTDIKQNESIRYGEKITEDKYFPVFTIQVGAFKNVSSAKTLATRLQRKGYRVEIIPLEKKDGILFRVRVGRFSNIQEAENVSEEIKRVEGLQTFIILLQNS